MEAKEESKTTQELIKGEESKLDDQQIGEAVPLQIEGIKQKMISPFINQKRSWDDEEYKIPAGLKAGIKDGLNWERPSKIQAMAIPFIINVDEDSKQHDSLIAQAKNGAGKSGAFIIGSILRINPAIKKTQVIIIGHTRELVM